MIQKIESLPEWKGKIDRVAAEGILKGRAVGSYILRKGDKITEATTQQLRSSNHHPLESYLYTVIESDNKVADVLLLHNTKGWTVYRDNPDLSDPEYAYFSTVTQLISNIYKKFV